ncbi:Chromosome partition protein Smc [Andreprevotia sp. IGB-42]|uniref:DNA-binding protein n=1 Tax=Andreprevotia sp. IGB-42 TaxID=2497473 RepID=UPI0013581D0E|nr:DNA-binding protein [Andreprevotia sp. IGB-42]KAF0813382.1 Chromosome partition protein Smc [Andreprevotia sp. IGB-42]
MARSGVYKSEVQRARDSLVAQGRKPSIDAVRVALGNTGSKTTISRYLKELDEEEGQALGATVAVNDALQDLVGRLATRLHGEADARIEAAKNEFMQQLHERDAAIALGKQANQALTTRLNAAEAELQATQSELEIGHQALIESTVLVKQLEQQVAGLNARLEDGQQHRESLEQKHQHARDALDHYRQSVKDQREQDQRRHEQQVQQLHLDSRQLRDTLLGKGEEIIELNREAARLASELQHAREAIRQSEVAKHSMAKELDALQKLARDRDVLETQLQRCHQDLANALETGKHQQAAMEILEEQLHAKDLTLADMGGKLSFFERSLEKPSSVQHTSS